MFKSTRWKGQNSKIKAVFQMQFQATQVPKLKGKGLMISLIPADIGKPTAKLEKAKVVEGICTWENPIYETVKLIKHQKSERYKEKIYYFNVATGSSKAGFVGEVGVDFADFAEATEPLQISLPLTTSDSGAILHVFIQKMQRKDELRELENNASPQAESVRLKSQASDCSENGNILDFTEEHTLVRRNSMPQNKTADAHMRQRSSTDWSLGSVSDRSMADLLNSPEHIVRPEASNNAVEMLKTDICRLERQAEVSEMELESLRKQIVKENKWGQDLSRQIVDLKEENYGLKTVANQSETSEDLRILLDEIREELKHEKNSNKVLKLQLQKTEESNSELLFAVNDLDKTLEQKNTEISYLSEKVKESQMVKETMAYRRDFVEEENLTIKQKIEDLCAEIEVYRKDKEELTICLENTSIECEFLQQENSDLSSKLEQTQIEQMKMQSEYSKSLAIIKEYEVQVERLEEKITTQALEFSQCLDTINELENHVMSLEKELDKQQLDFKDDVEAMMKVKVDQEQRVIQAEEALRKSRLTNAVAAEHLQEELTRLSAQMDSKLDEKEKLTSEAVAEAQNLRQEMRELQEALIKSHEELSLTKDLHEQKVQQLKQSDLSFEKGAEMPKEWSKEREELQTEFVSLRKEAEKLKVESTSWKSLMDEKNVLVRSLQSELKILRGNYNELKESLVVTELEKGNLREEVSRLEHNLRKKEDAHLNLLEESKVAREVSISTWKHDEREITENTFEESISVLVSAKSNEGSGSEKEQRMPTSHRSDDHNLNTLLTEMSSLDERNKHMENELKEMQEKYSEISLRFAEVEGERQQLVMTLRNLRNGKKK